jgi:cell division protein FtsA
VVITGGGAMLKHLPQLVRFKTAMDVRIGFPNEHLGGNSKDEINQPMFATSVGLIMRGLDYLETYKSNFNAGAKSEMSEEEEKALEEQKVEAETADPDDFDDKLSWTEKFKKSLSKMFETEDQSIN